MKSTGVDLFVNAAGTEVSVRTSRHVATDALIIEPLYATDIELLDGATGELHTQGETRRGTLRRNGGTFVLAADEPPARPPRRKRETAPAPAVPVVPRVAAPRADPEPQAVPAPQVIPEQQADESAASHDEAVKAADILSLFVRGARGVPLKAARLAHTVLGRFIAERERQARTRT